MKEGGCIFALLVLLGLFGPAIWLTDSAGYSPHHGVVIGHAMCVATDGDGETIITESGGPSYGPVVLRMELLVREGSVVHTIVVGSPNYKRFKDGDPIRFVINGFNVAYLPR